MAYDNPLVASSSMNKINPREARKLFLVFFVVTRVANDNKYEYDTVFVDRNGHLPGLCSLRVIKWRSRKRVAIRKTMKRKKK